MTRKWGPAQDWVFRFLLERDGENCYLCGKLTDAKGSKTLIIEHKDNNSDNPDPANLGLAHPSCNTKKNPPKQGVSPSGSSQTVCVKKSPIPVVRSDGFAPNKNAVAEPAFRRWVFGIVLSNRLDPKTYDWLVENGSAWVGANPVTVERYLDKMLAEVFGCLAYNPSERWGQVVVMKFPEDYEKTVEELDQAYPWRGQMHSETFRSVTESAKPSPTEPILKSENPA